MGHCRQSSATWCTPATPKHLQPFSLLPFCAADYIKTKPRGDELLGSGHVATKNEVGKQLNQLQLVLSKVAAGAGARKVRLTNRVPGLSSRGRPGWHLYMFINGQLHMRCEKQGGVRLLLQP